MGKGEITTDSTGPRGPHPVSICGACLAPGHIEGPLQVTGWLRDDVGITTCVPRIAADLLQRPSRQSRARTGGHICPLDEQGSLGDRRWGSELLRDQRDGLLQNPNSRPERPTHQCPRHHEVLLPRGRRRLIPALSRLRWCPPLCWLQRLY